MINTAVGKDTYVSSNQPDLDAESAAARRLAEALEPSAIDALLADAKAAGTPIDDVDGLLNQMTKAVLERVLQSEMTQHLGYERDDPTGAGAGAGAVKRRAMLSRLFDGEYVGLDGGVAAGAADAAVGGLGDVVGDGSFDHAGVGAHPPSRHEVV